MTTRKQLDRLRTFEDVEHLLTPRIMDRLVNTAGVPAEKAKSFLDDLRNSIRNYLQDAQRPSPGEGRDRIEYLAKTVDQALEDGEEYVEAVVQTITALPPEARSILEAGSGGLPSANDLRDVRRSREALLLLAGICASGSRVVKGRKRPGGKQSRPTLETEYRGPRVRKGHPGTTNEIFLCASVGQAYLKATDRLPTRWPSPKNRGPFVYLMAEVLDLVDSTADVRAPMRTAFVRADDLVRRYGDPSRDDQG